MMRRTTPGELDGTNRRDLSIRKVCILDCEIDEQLTHRDRQRPMMVLSLSFGGPEEADHAMRIKGISGSTQAPFRQTRFLRPFSRRNPVKDDGSNPFIQALFWCPTPLLEQMIVVRSLPAFSLDLWHTSNSKMEAKETRLGASFASSMILQICYGKSSITTMICSEYRKIFPP